jgi:hypothetical protein
MTVKWKRPLQTYLKKGLIYSALPIYFLSQAHAQNSEDNSFASQKFVKSGSQQSEATSSENGEIKQAAPTTTSSEQKIATHESATDVPVPTEHVARDSNLGRGSTEDSYTPPYKFESFKRSNGVKTETTIVRDKKDLFNCAAEECLFSVWAGPKYIFTTGGLRSTYTQSAIPTLTFGAEKPFHRFKPGTFLTFGISVDFFGYASKAVGANVSASAVDQTSNNDALYGYTNILPYFGIEHYACPQLSFFFNVGPELQYRSLVIQNSVSSQPSDYIISTTVGIGAELGARFIMPITTGFNFFLRPAVGVNLGEAVNKSLVFQSVAGQNQSVDINSTTYSAALSAGGEF